MQLLVNGSQKPIAMSLQSLQPKPFHFNIPFLNESAVGIQTVDYYGSKPKNYIDWTNTWFRLAE